MVSVAAVVRQWGIGAEVAAPLEPLDFLAEGQPGHRGGKGRKDGGGLEQVVRRNEILGLVLFL